MFGGVDNISVIDNVLIRSAGAPEAPLLFLIHAFAETSIASIRSPKKGFPSDFTSSRLICGDSAAHLAPRPSIAFQATLLCNPLNIGDMERHTRSIGRRCGPPKPGGDIFFASRRQRHPIDLGRGRERLL